jgi:hypothetical protein
MTDPVEAREQRHARVPPAEQRVRQAQVPVFHTQLGGVYAVVPWPIGEACVVNQGSLSFPAAPVRCQRRRSFVGRL